MIFFYKTYAVWLDINYTTFVIEKIWKYYVFFVQSINTQAGNLGQHTYIIAAKNKILSRPLCTIKA